MEEKALSLFPYKYYTIQRDFCREFTRIITSIPSDGSARIGILESPTGTGKTTSLLCSALAWLLNGEGDEENCEDATSKVLDEPEWIRQARGQIMKRPKLEPIEMRTRTSKFKRKKSNDLDDSIQKLLEIVADSDEDQFTTRPPRKVYYCSRTHSQLAQVMTELKKILTIGQIGNIRAVTLASRKSTCINGAIRKLASAESVNQQCQELLTEDACPYYNKDKSAAMDALNVAFEGHAVVDIEEAVSIGRQHEACSYYGSRRYAIGAEIVTVPYNMILSRVTRDALDIDLRDALIIFDEAHNLVDAINELESCIVTREEIELISVGLRVYLSKFERRLSPNHHVLLQQLQHLTFRVATFMDKEDDKADIWMVNSFLTECGIEHINLLKIVDYLRESNLSPKLAFYSIEDQVNESGDPQTLNRFAKVLMALAASDADGRLIKGPIKLEYVALNPATVMRELCESAHSIILAGGTMKPIDDVVLQLFNKTNIRSYSCGHLDSIKQNVLGLVIGSGPTGVPLRFTHATRQDEKLLADTQQTLANICNIVPDGVVCFFASYQALDHFIANWTTRPLVEAKKQIFAETTAKDSTEKLFKNYQHAIASGRGGLMLAVMGGRLSEGVNFSDRLARAVIVVGQPFPNILDAETRERSNHYARLRGDQSAIQEYLENLCMRSVNQTIGRAIRHADDYAAIILLDERYSRMREKLPEWIQSTLFPTRGAADFGSAFGQLVKV